MDHSGPYTLVRRVEDEKFSIDDLTHYSLMLMVGKYCFQLCIVDTREGACVIVEDYTIKSAISVEQQVTALYQLFENHKLLMAGYWHSVKLAVKTDKFTLVPDAFFSRDKLPHYLELSVASDSEHDGFYYYHHVQSGAVNVFAANKKLVERIRSLYPSLEIPVIHHGSALVEGIQANRDFTYYKDLYLHLDRDRLSVVVTEDNRLLLYNRFPCYQPSDMVKYALTVMKELDMDRNESRVTLWSNLPEHTDYVKVLYQYVRKLEVGNRPSFLKFSYAFDELPDYQYVDLYGLYVCES